MLARADPRRTLLHDPSAGVSLSTESRLQPAGLAVAFASHMLRAQMSRMTLEEAQTVALQALAHLAGDAEALGRFLALTGIGPAELAGRARSGDRALLSAVLEHYLNFEPDLLAFCTASKVNPKLPAEAARLLAGTPRP
jgi:hypothetical protein